MKDIEKIINSLKGLSGTGNVLGQFVELYKDGTLTLEPGDFTSKDGAMAAPIGYDLWYLWTHDNFLLHYYIDSEGKPTIDGKHYDYSPYLLENLCFLLPGLKPLKTLADLEQLAISERRDVFDRVLQVEWANNGIYWINTMAFELWLTGLGAQYASDGPESYVPNDYVGYLTFPIGQLGVMEVVSLIQETLISGYKFQGTYVKTPAEIKDDEKPTIKTPAEIFPGMEGAGENKCCGKHLIESAYLVPETPTPSAKRDVELFSKDMEKYPEKVQPKMWMRYWIHKESTVPVPGEFIGILCKPVACPPHVWWFQESSPFLYAGNWMEIGNLTSGVVTAVTLEADRTDGKIGNQYKVKIQGCEVTIEASDFLVYSVGDRVAVVKVASINAAADKSFTWLDQPILKATDKGTEKPWTVMI